MVVVLGNGGYHYSRLARRWWADLPALEQARAVLLDRMEAHCHRPEGITLPPVHTFCEVA